MPSSYSSARTSPFFRKDRTSIVLTFLVPFVLIYLFGQVYGVNKTQPGPSGIKVAVVNQERQPGGGPAGGRPEGRAVLPGGLPST